MQAALEAGVTGFLGRDRYQRAAARGDARPGSRNGYGEVTVKTTVGPVGLSRPKLRGTTEAFASRLFGSHVTRTNALESLVIASFVRGLSVRDVEAALAEALGDEAAISKSTVSSVCQQIKDEYEAWARRRLDSVRIDYLFLDASFFRMHPRLPGRAGAGRLGHHHRGQARVAAVQVKARAPGYAMGAGEVFGALATLVQERDACRYQLLTNARAGASAGELMAVLRDGHDASRLRSLMDGVLASVSADRRRAQLRGLDGDQVLRLSHSQASFDAREDTEIRDGLISRLRRYRNQHSAGLGDESAGLMVGYLLSEIFRRAADAGASVISVGEFEALVLTSGAVLTRTLGHRDWGVVVGRVPVMPDVRRSGLLDQVHAALDLPAGQAGVRRCVLTGMSGIGKTSLAASYVLDRADVYDVVFWIDGESEQTLTSSFERVFRYLRDGRDGQGSLVPPDPARLRDAVHDELSQVPGTWLMVLDNCVRPSLAEQWMPGSGSGHVIVTTKIVPGRRRPA